MAEYKDTDEIIEKIRAEFKMNWEVPCDSEDRIIQAAISKVYRIIREQPAADVVPKAAAGAMMDEVESCVIGILEPSFQELRRKYLEEKL